jgi:hypothetical protein
LANKDANTQKVIREAMNRTTKEKAGISSMQSFNKGGKHEHNKEQKKMTATQRRLGEIKSPLVIHLPTLNAMLVGEEATRKTNVYS